MIGAGVLGRQQQEDQVDGLVIEGLEVDRLIQPREHGHDLVQRRYAPMRNGDAAADAGGAQPLALQQRIQDVARVEPGELGGALRELLQRLLLGLGLQRRKYRFRRYEIGEIHDLSLASPRRALNARLDAYCSCTFHAVVGALDWESACNRCETGSRASLPPT